MSEPWIALNLKMIDMPWWDSKGDENEVIKVTNKKQASAFFTKLKERYKK